MPTDKIETLSDWISTLLDLFKILKDCSTSYLRIVRTLTDVVVLLLGSLKP